MKREEEYMNEKKIERELLAKRAVSAADSKWYIKQKGYEDVHRYMIRNHDYSAYSYLPDDIKYAICYINSQTNIQDTIDECSQNVTREPYVINQKTIFYDNILEILRKTAEYKQALLALNESMKKNLCLYDEYEKKDIFFKTGEEFNRALLHRTDSPYFSEYASDTCQAIIFLDSYCFSKGMSTEDICKLYTNPDCIEARRNMEKIYEYRNTLNEKIFNARKDELIDICTEILYAAINKNEQLMKSDINGINVINSIREYIRLANIYKMFTENFGNGTQNEKVFMASLNERIVNEEQFKGLTLKDILSALELYYICLANLEKIDGGEIVKEMNQTLAIDMTNTGKMYKIPILLNQISLICRHGNSTTEKILVMARMKDYFNDYAKVAANKFDSIYEWDKLDGIFEEFNIGTLQSEKLLTVIAGNVKQTGFGRLKFSIRNSDRYNEVIKMLKNQIVIENTIGRKNRDAYNRCLRKTYFAACNYLNKRKGGSNRYNNIVILKKHLERLIDEKENRITV